MLKCLLILFDMWFTSSLQRVLSHDLVLHRALSSLKWLHHPEPVVYSLVTQPVLKIPAVFLVLLSTKTTTGCSQAPIIQITLSVTQLGILVKAMTHEVVIDFFKWQTLVLKRKSWNKCKFLRAFPRILLDSSEESSTRSVVSERIIKRLSCCNTWRKVSNHFGGIVHIFKRVILVIKLY